MQQKETKFIVKRSAAYIDSKFGCCPHGKRFGYGLTRHDDFRKNAKLSGHMLDAARRLTLVLKFDNILSIRRLILLESISESAGSISLIIFPTFIYTLSNILEKTMVSAMVIDKVGIANPSMLSRSPIARFRNKEWRPSDDSPRATFW